MSIAQTQTDEQTLRAQIKALYESVDTLNEADLTKLGTVIAGMRTLFVLASADLGYWQKRAGYHAAFELIELYRPTAQHLSDFLLLGHDDNPCPLCAGVRRLKRAVWPVPESPLTLAVCQDCGHAERVE